MIDTNDGLTEPTQITIIDSFFNIKVYLLSLGFELLDRWNKPRLSLIILLLPPVTLIFYSIVYCYVLICVAPYNIAKDKFPFNVNLMDNKVIWIWKCQLGFWETVMGRLTIAWHLIENTVTQLLQIIPLWITILHLVASLDLSRMGSHFVFPVCVCVLFHWLYST